MYDDDMIRSDEDRQLERVIVLQLVSEAASAGLSREQLRVQLDEADPRDFTDAIEQLGAAGVIEVAGETVRASRASVHLSELQLIAV